MKTDLLKKIMCFSAAFSVLFYFSGTISCADGGYTPSNVVTADTVSIEQMLEDIPAESIVVRESSTGTILFQKNSQEVLPISHLAKLMTGLIAADCIENGELAYDDIVTVSANSNSQQGSQIWLDKGENISVEELVKSITIGNANDACVALSEKIGGSETEFVDLMNEKAGSFGMKSTHFEDCTGLSANTVSTAEDIALLCENLIDYEDLTQYYTTYMDSVRNGKAELVSLNRLVRTYKGIKGFKACASKEAGDCSAVCAERNDMSVTVVILGCSSSEEREAATKKLLDMSFESYQIYSPEITDEMLEKITVKGGETDSIETYFEYFRPVIIPRGSYGSVEIEFTKKESVDAPVHKNEKVGEILCKIGDETILKADLRACETVKKMNFKCGFLKLMYNLLCF